MHDEIPITENAAFRPRYDTLDKDWDRLMEHCVELLHQGVITREPGRALNDTHIAPAFEKVIDGYFARARYAELEAYFTSSEVYATWPFEGELATWRRLADAGQTARVVRLWRAHIACLKQNFWYLVRERNAGFRKPKHSGMSDESDRASYEALVAKIPRTKEDLLGVMTLARTWFEEIGATEAQRERLATERAEVEAEARRKPEGKPDPRAMDDTVFWEVIGMPENGIAEQLEGAVARLERFKATVIKGFDRQLEELYAAAYRQDIWALAYLLGDGCSDDSFAAFRCWLILQGRAVFEGALADPNAFDVSRFDGEVDGALALLDVPLLAYETRSGKPMVRRPVTLPALDVAEEEGFAAMLPHLAAELRRARSAAAPC